MYNNLNKKRLVQLVGLALTTTLFSGMAAAEVTGKLVSLTTIVSAAFHKPLAILPCKAVLIGASTRVSLSALGQNVTWILMSQVITALLSRYDFYVAYGGEINEDLTYDITPNCYNYSGESDIGYFEVTAGMDYKGFRAAYWYTNDYGGSDLDYHYAELNYSYEFVEKLESRSALYGYNVGDALDDGEGFDSYSDYSVGVSTELSGFGLSLG